MSIAVWHENKNAAYFLLLVFNKIIPNSSAIIAYIIYCIGESIL